MRLCEKCFASVEPDAPFCPECGAPLGDTSEAEGSDAAIYPELARANLLRMRGQYKPAEDVCLGILRRFPNNASSNTLLGDICAERGDLEQASEWYDLALDIASDSDAVREKLAGVKLRLAEREAAATATKIGLPTQPPKTALYSLITVLAIVAVGVAAYFLGRQATPERQGVLDTPIDVTAARRPIPQSNETPAPIEQATTAPAWHDVALTSALSAKLREGNRIVDAWQDPRTHALLVTCISDTPEGFRLLAANVGGSALQNVATAQLVTVRIVSNGVPAYVADVPRERFEEITSDAWRQEHGDTPQAWVDRLLTNEWPPAEGPAAVEERPN